MNQINDKTGLKQKVAAFGVLATVSAVSLLAGGLILGAASADDGDDPSEPTNSLFQAAPEGVAVLSAMADGEKGCVIAFGHGPEDAGQEGGTPFFAGKPIDGVAGSRIEVGKQMSPDGDVKTWKIVDGELVEGELPDGGLPSPATVANAIQAKPISPEEIELLKASGELRVVTPEDCKVVDIEDMPEGFPPARLSTGGFNRAPSNN